MVICQHQTVRCKDDAGPCTRVAAMHVDDRGADGFDGADDGLRIGVEQLIVVDARFGVHEHILERTARPETTQMG